MFFNIQPLAGVLITWNLHLSFNFAQRTYFLSITEDLLRMEDTVITLEVSQAWEPLFYGRHWNFLFSIYLSFSITASVLLRLTSCICFCFKCILWLKCYRVNGKRKLRQEEGVHYESIGFCFQLCFAAVAKYFTLSSLWLFHGTLKLHFWRLWLNFRQQFLTQS